MKAINISINRLKQINSPSFQVDELFSFMDLMWNLTNHDVVNFFFIDAHQTKKHALIDDVHVDFLWKFFWLKPNQTKANRTEPYHMLFMCVHYTIFMWCVFIFFSGTKLNMLCYVFFFIQCTISVGWVCFYAYWWSTEERL